MKKTYVVDTNILLSDPNAIFSFEDNDVIIPLVVLEELDNHKSRLDDVGRAARVVSRSLDDLRKKGSLFQGVQLNCGGTLRVASIGPTDLSELPIELKATLSIPKVDNMIVAFMIKYSLQNPDAILVSKDINVRLKCDSLGLKCDDYKKMRVTQDPEQLYTGVTVMHVTQEMVAEFYEKKCLNLGQDLESLCQLHPNEIVVLKCLEQGNDLPSGLARFVRSGEPLVPINDVRNVFNLQPKNKEQKFALDLLLNPDIKLVTLTGAAGSGKTAISLAAALAQLKSIGDNPLYDKLIVTKPIQPMGKDIGYLPGSLEEKMDPWIAPIKDNINFLMGNKKAQVSRRKRDRADEVGRPMDEYYLSLLQENGLIEIEALTFIRGRSIPNAFILIDEGQNLSMHEIKTIITRAGEGSKIVITGDISQIDNVHVDANSNGLAYVVEKFKHEEIAGHVGLIKGVRSPLATIASQIL